MADETIPEEWRIVANYPDYEISSLGRIRRATDWWRINWRSKKPHIFCPAGRILKPSCNESGGSYRKVVLYSRDGKHKTYKVAVLVCAAFHGERPSSKHLVAHWNGNRSDDNKDNLRWATHKENSEDAARHGTFARGAEHGQSKITESDVVEIREMIRRRITYEVIQAKYGITPGTISAIKHRATWKHVP